MKLTWSPPTIVVLLMVQWSSIMGQTRRRISCDEISCPSKRFMRFGRDMGPDPYYRLRRQFFRLNRSYQPYQDKRYLRFGRSQLGDLQGFDDNYNTDIVEPYSRKRRSLDTDSQLEITHNHVRRSVDQSELEQPGNDDTSKMIKKRAIAEKRFMRFGRDFSRDEDKDDIDEENSQFSKRFMRFGKRFMRFGRNHAVGSTGDILAAPLSETNKRFMRFGKRESIDDANVENVLEEANINKLNNVLSLASQLKSQQRSLVDQSELEQPGSDSTTKNIKKRAILEKRFMRFGRGFSRDDDEDNIDDENSQFSKRFMRFGKRLVPVKRFMRFGRNLAGDILVAPLSETSKRFMRFGKRKNLDDSNIEDVESNLEEANMNSLNNVLSLANRLKSEAGELGGGLYGQEKRFMRFGKREANADDLVKEG